MDCRRFERALDDLACGRLPAAERLACERHAASCGACGELLALATLADASAPAELADAILARTTGAACERVTRHLPALVDGDLPTADRELVTGHLAGCGECAALAATLVRLAGELPRLAEVRPDAGFVDAVLRRTLPLDVQLRRWWRRTWPRWVRRPRIASEVAYVGSLVLVLVFATPGSPLEAVPRQALDAVSGPVESTEPGLGAAMGRRIAAQWAVVENAGRESFDSWMMAGAGSAARARELAGELGAGAATLWQEAASLLERTGDDAAPEPSIEEKP